MLHHPCILGEPRNKGEQNQKWLLTPAILGAENRAEALCHPCILGDPQTKGDKIKSGCLNPAFSGAQKSAEMLCHPCSQKTGLWQPIVILSPFVWGSLRMQGWRPLLGPREGSGEAATCDCLPFVWGPPRMQG